MSRPSFEQHNKVPEGKKEQDLDRTTVLAHFNYDEALMANHLDRFAKECPPLLSEVLDFLELGDMKKLLTATHALKFFVKKFSARKALETLVLLEATAGNGDLALAQKA